MNRKVSVGYEKVIYIILLICGFLAAGTVVAYGSSAPDATGIINESDGVNIRASYSTSSAIVGALPDQSTVTITEEKYTVSGSSDKTTIWYHIDSAYGDGYIRSDLATIRYSAVSAKTSGIVNMRKGPGTAFDSVGKLAKGDSVKVVLKALSSGNSVWYKISSNGSYYYVSGSYIAFDSGNAPSQDVPSSDQNFEAQLADFPVSYRAALRALHEKHPTWNFKARSVGYTWAEALKKQTSNVNANLVSVNFPDSYKEVRSGTYNFKTHTYIGKDGANWVAASEEAVAFYMDPRNWLDEVSVFMFEPYTYDASYQKESIVKSILKNTALPAAASAYYMAAAQQTYGGKNYNISPTFLAAKTRIELGSSAFTVNGHSFTYGGKKYSGVYNTYNIGATDSADGSAATKGLVYAAGGADGTGTSYLRPWNSLEKAIKGGAIYIAKNFQGNNQHTGYLTRYNVLNGLNSVGTYQYATAIFSAATEASVMSTCYQDADTLDESFTFEIPVYEDMPSAASPKPGSGNNNNYLDSLKVYEGETQKSLSASFSRFTTDYKLKTSVSSSSVTIKTTTNADDAKVSVSGNTNLKSGSNKITIKVTSSTGKVRNYYLTVTKEEESAASEIAAEKITGLPTIVTIKDKEAIEAARAAYDKLTQKEKDAFSKELLNKLTDAEKQLAQLEDDEYSAYLKEGVKNTSIKIYSSSKTGSITISWVKELGFKVDGYEIYRSVGNKTSFKRYDRTQKTSYKNSNYLTKGKRYYYKVRGYRNINGETVYTQWTMTIYRVAK